MVVEYIDYTVTWTVPSGAQPVQKITTALLYGGGSGGCGGDYHDTGYGGYGGTASTGVTTSNIAVTPGESLSCVVGAGGTAGAGIASHFFTGCQGGTGGTTTLKRGGADIATQATGASISCNCRTWVTYYIGIDGTAGYAGAGGAPGGSSGSGDHPGAGGAGWGAGGGGGCGENSGAGVGSAGGAGGQGVIELTYTYYPIASWTADDYTVTAGTTVTFADTSTNTPTSWDWDWKDGTSHGTTQNPTHVFNVAGNYAVTLTATNAGGSSVAVSSHTIVVTMAAPVAAFSGVPTSGNVPFTVTFTDSSTGTPSSWLWDFGDSGTSTAQNPSHEYTTAVGSPWQVTLTATNAGGSDAEVKAAYIAGSAVSVAGFVVKPSSVFQLTPFCDDDDPTLKIVKLYDKSTFAGSAASSWAWSVTATGITSAVTSTLQNPEIKLPVMTGATPVIYWTVTLFVRNCLNVLSAGATVDYAIVQRYIIP